MEWIWGQLIGGGAVKLEMAGQMGLLVGLVPDVKYAFSIVVPPKIKKPRLLMLQALALGRRLRHFLSGAKALERPELRTFISVTGFRRKTRVFTRGNSPSQRRSDRDQKIYSKNSNFVQGLCNQKVIFDGFFDITKEIEII